MSGYNGNGVFSFTYLWTLDAANGIPITASRMDTEFSDATGGFNLVICRDGQSTTTAAIPFAVGLNTDTVNPVTMLGPVSFPAGQIKFPAAQNPSANANTLDDYEEGTWTPVDASTAGLVLTVNRASYVKIGSLVFCDVTLAYPVTADGNNAKIGGLPFTAANVAGVGGAFVFSVGAAVFAEGILGQNATTFTILSSGGSPFVNSQLSGLGIRAQFMIFTV